MPHDRRIDGIIWPEFRDMLVAGIESDLDMVLAEMLESMDVHDGEVCLSYQLS